MEISVSDHFLGLIMDGSGKERPIETPENKAFSQDGEKTVNKLRKKRETKWERGARRRWGRGREAEIS